MKKNYLISLGRNLYMAEDELRDFLKECDESNSDYEPIIDADKLMRDTMCFVTDWSKAEEGCQNWPEQFGDFEKVYNNLKAAKEHLENYNDREVMIDGEDDARITTALYDLDKAIKTAETMI